MHTRFKLGLILAIGIMVFSIVGMAHAQEETAAPCEGETVSGTVVAVDEETGTVTVETEDGECTVTVDSDYEHPIVALLGSYFGDVNMDDLTEALEATEGCAVQDTETGDWAWADCDKDGAVEVQVTGINEDGTFTATADGEEISVTVGDADESDELSEALEALTTEWDLGEDGDLVQAGDEIQEYHEDGMGFGVLTKLYAMAAESQEACDEEEVSDEDASEEETSEEPCGVTADELVTAFQSGTGLGQLFKEYGKPSILGVGHVKHALDNADDDGDATNQTGCTPRGKKGKNCDKGNKGNKGKGKGGE